MARSESVPLLGLTADELEQMARVAGASRCEFLGGYEGEAYVRESSLDLLLIASRLCDSLPSANGGR